MSAGPDRKPDVHHCANKETTHMALGRASTDRKQFAMRLEARYLANLLRSQSINELSDCSGLPPRSTGYFHGNESH